MLKVEVLDCPRNTKRISGADDINDYSSFWRCWAVQVRNFGAKPTEIALGRGHYFPLQPPDFVTKTIFTK
jgi:hypothetical protein